MVVVVGGVLGVACCVDGVLFALVVLAGAGGAVHAFAGLSWGCLAPLDFAGDGVDDPLVHGFFPAGGVWVMRW